MKRIQVKENQLQAAKLHYNVISERKLIYNRAKGFWWYMLVIEA